MRARVVLLPATHLRAHQREFFDATTRARFMLLPQRGTRTLSPGDENIYESPALQSRMPNRYLRAAPATLMALLHSLRGALPRCQPLTGREIPTHEFHAPR